VLNWRDTSVVADDKKRKTTALDASRLSTELVHIVQAQLNILPVARVRELICELHSYLTLRARTDVTAAESKELHSFLHELAESAAELEFTFELVSECFTGSEITLNYSLVKIKQVVNASASASAQSSSSSSVSTMQQIAVKVPGSTATEGKKNE
jgi:hypothetical protein